MGKLIVPRHTGEMEYIMTAMEVYNNHYPSWLSNNIFINEQSTVLISKKIDSAPKTDKTHYTKDAEMIRYFGFAERRIEGDPQSDVRLTESGKNFYDAWVKKDFLSCQDLLMEAMETTIFGRNNEGCGSDSDVEAPKVCVQASLVLDGITKSELAFILDRLDCGFDINSIYLEIVKCRSFGISLPSYSITEDQKYVQFMRNVEFFEKNPRAIKLTSAIKSKFWNRIQKLNIFNNAVLKFITEETVPALKYYYPLQRIFYGAPGTGKSYKTNEIVRNFPDTIRTTFHPDSDYASFVGCYKPIEKEGDPLMQVVADFATQQAISIPVIDSAGNPVLDKNITYKFTRQAFLKAYILAWKKMCDAKFVTKVIPATATGAITGGPAPVEEKQEPILKDPNNLNIDNSSDTTTETIFEQPQQYLVIEEINRGNCAQIFGDIFQLLDRGEEGFSEYPIEADEDIRKELKNELASSLSLYDPATRDYINNLYTDADGNPVTYEIDGKGTRVGTLEAILNGKILVLPCNLNLLATMNTSDQSLFPMDSAFKRRWDWEYVPITNAEKGWKIELENNSKIDWWTFLQSINMVIADLTSSEDKQLGYFFTKPDKDSTTISAKRFVSKVIFYLWNDVFKDYGFEPKCCKDDAEKEVLYAKFYAENGKDINLDVLKRFFKKLQDENGNPLL